MAQTAVTKFYSTRKRFKDPVKSLKTLEHEKLSETFVKSPELAVIHNAPDVVNRTRVEKVNKLTDCLKSHTESGKTKKDKNLEPQKFSESSQKEKKQTVNVDPPKVKAARSKKVNKVTNYLKPQSVTKDISKDKELKQNKLPETLFTTPEPTVISQVPKTKAAKTKSKKVNKVTNYLEPQPETSKTKKNAGLQDKETDVSQTSHKNLSKDEASQVKQTEVPQTPEKNLKKSEAFQQETTEASRTPKRNLTSPDELTPSKRKALQEPFSPAKSTPGKLKESNLTPQKVDPTARKLLYLSSPNRIMSPRKIASPVKNQLSPQKAASYQNMSKKDLTSLVHESRNKILFSGKLDELKKSLSTFSKVSARTKEFQANSCKITSVIASAKPSDNESKSVFQGEPAYKKYSYLAAPESKSLILPKKYKILEETFRCMDLVVSMLNNRKENITFEKVKNGVQKMMKKNFVKSQLGQIMTVFPEAYSLVYEKNDSYTYKNNSSDYDLVMNPRLSDLKGNSTSSESSLNGTKKISQSSFIHMTPQVLLVRKNLFLHNLTNEVKKHHRDFLKRLNFPAVDDNAIVRWHQNFNVDGVPDIPVAALPEEPETKVYSAKDVLNKIRGTVRGRVEKALENVANAHKDESNEKSSPTAELKNNSSNRKQSSALKGICSDLLEKIRAREATKAFENMTRSVQDEKRAAKLESLPKIVHILWHYFIAERKSAVSVDAAVDKIIHSSNSLTTPEEVKEYLQLITETMPGWLSFIKVPKGEFITMDKKRDINEMINNLQ